MRYASLLVAAFVLAHGFPSPLAAQNEEDLILETIESLFEGMLAADSTMVASAFHPDARLVAIDAGDAEPRPQISYSRDFIEAVGRSGGGWNERFWNPLVRIDGPLAMVWADYDFHRGERFSHCGVDVFHLIRGADGWKIISIAYTRRREGCEAPAGN